MKGLSLLETVLAVCAFFLISLPWSCLAADYTFKYSNLFPASHKQSIVAEQWCKEIERRTNGRVNITYYAGSTLVLPQQTYDSVAKGIADIGMSVFGYTRGKFSLMEVIDLPLGYKSGLEATRLINLLYKKFRPKELEDLKVLYLHAHGPGIFHTIKSVSKLEDMRALKIRSVAVSAKIVQALAAVPVALPMGEAYQALEKGVVDGVILPLEGMKGWKLGAVVKATTQSFGAAYSTGFFVVMNKNRWNSLPPDIQRVFEEVNEEWIEKQGTVWDELDREGMDFIRARGNRIIPLSDSENERWAAKVRPILDEYVTNMKSRGLPGEAALNFCLDRLKAGPTSTYAERPVVRAKDDVQVARETSKKAPIATEERYPDVRVALLRIDDKSGNGKIEPAEIVDITARVENKGKDTAKRVFAELIAGDGVFFKDSETSFQIGDLDSGSFKDIRFTVYTRATSKAMSVSIRVSGINDEKYRKTSDLNIEFGRSYTQPKKDSVVLNLHDVVDLLTNEVPKERIVALVKRHGIAFVANEENLTILKKEGADSAVIDALLKEGKMPYRASSALEGHPEKGSTPSAGAVRTNNTDSRTASPGFMSIKYKMYYNLIWNKIRNGWVLPDEVLRGKKDLETIIGIRIAKDGQIVDIQFEKKSGNPFLDESALRAIKKANPLPPLPPGFEEDNFEVGVRFIPSIHRE